MCLFCFSSEPLSEDEKQGRYGASMGQYGQFQEKYDISMCQAPAREPGCCCLSMLCFCPVQIYMRHRVLNHVDHGSGWNNYKCCQGYFGNFSCGDSSCPVPCMCLEAFCCPGCAVSATSYVIRERYNLGLDEDDVRLIRCNNCLQVLSCVCFIVACITPCEGDDVAARIIDCIADAVFCAISACMTAQTYHEVNMREKMTAPDQMQMNRM